MSMIIYLITIFATAIMAALIFWFSATQTYLTIGIILSFGAIVTAAIAEKQKT